ncbi:hypothetical protein F0U61_10300 [Archangium violaceum]|uniref:hypothetical protein n=1 Tax=Archangium violaceum TaxID=83451 RepID=UPI002B309DBF|nr:hypothetical protein F0U61_10300 [Archangium violaceum]
MSLEWIVFAVFLMIACTQVIRWVGLEQKRTASWTAMAGPLGLTYEKGDLAGELDGLPVRIFRESGERMGDKRMNESVYVVQVEVPAKLPRGFVAAPRRWTSLSERLLSPNVFKAAEPVLDEAYIFQSDDVEPGQKLLQEPDVQQALCDLVNPDSVSFVRGRHVGLAYRNHTFVEDADKVRRNLMLLARTARALAQAQERLRSAA